MYSTNKSKLSLILAILSLVVGLPLFFTNFVYLFSHILDLVRAHRGFYNPSPNTLGENLGLIALRFFLSYISLLLISTGIFVFKNKISNQEDTEYHSNRFTKSLFIQTLLSPKPLYYTNIIIAFLLGLIGSLITFTSIAWDGSTFGVLYGIIFLIITVYSFKGAFSLIKNRNNIPKSKVLLKNIILMPFRMRSILLIGSLILIFIGFLTTQGESVLGIGEFDGIVFLVIGGFLFTRVKYFCKVCGRKMSRVGSSYRGREYANFQVHSTDTQVWIEGDVSDDYDYLYWCSHCKSYERLISKRTTNRVKIGE